MQSPDQSGPILAHVPEAFRGNFVIGRGGGGNHPLAHDGIRKGVIGPHAWNRLGGKVLDLIWYQGRANPATVYLGVPIETDFLHWSQASGGPVAFLNWAKRQQDGKS